MKKMFILLVFVCCLACSLTAEQVWVNGHYRSAPDEYKWNNRVSNTNRDLDNDGILNENDWDDNNNGIGDDYE